MLVPFRLLDVFADAPFTGNQLCVVPDVPADLDAQMMLTLAREIAFSETTFVTSVRDDGYDVRIFTPDGELPFAGHPTIGTAYVLVSDERVSPSLVQTSAAGDVPVDTATIGSSSIRSPSSSPAPVATAARSANGSENTGGS